MKAVLVVLVGLFISATDAAAHTRSESYSHWYADNTTLTGIVTMPLREVMLLYQRSDAALPPGQMLQQHLLDNVGARSDGGDCGVPSGDVLQAASGVVRIELRFDCGSHLPAGIRFRAIFGVAPGHVHFARLHRDGALLGEALMTDSSSEFAFSSTSAQNHSFFSFVRIGVEHIAGGLDHIAFLLGLLLVAGSLGRSIIAVTGFTLGHSLSLAAAVLGYVSAESQLVEAFIGFTVALVAAEHFTLRRDNATPFALFALVLAWGSGIAAITLGFLSPRALFAYAGFGVFAACYLLATSGAALPNKRSSMLLFVATCCFGVVHGFGFAGFLMETGLGGTSLFAPLFGFNVGVEAGQLVVVAAALAGAKLIQDRTPRVLPQLLAAGLCGIGVFWFMTRTIA